MQGVSVLNITVALVAVMVLYYVASGATRSKKTAEPAENAEEPVELYGMPPVELYGVPHLGQMADNATYETPILAVERDDRQDATQIALESSRHGNLQANEQMATLRPIMNK